MTFSAWRSNLALVMVTTFQLTSLIAIGHHTGDRSLKTTGVVCHFVGYARPIQSAFTTGRSIMVLVPRIMLWIPFPLPISMEIMCVGPEPSYCLTILASSY